MEKILDFNLPGKRRRDLLPIWIKPFIFLFLALGILALYGIGRNSLGFESESTIYGLESYTVFSLMGIFLKSIMLFKAVVSYGLWMEKDWAIKLGIIDAIFGIIVCILVMVVFPFVDFIDGINELNIRFEIFLLVPYLIWLLKIKKEWENFNSEQSLASHTFESKFSAPQPVLKVDEVITEKVMPEIKTEPTEKIDKEDPRRFMPK